MPAISQSVAKAAHLALRLPGEHRTLPRIHAFSAAFIQRELRRDLMCAKLSKQEKADWWKAPHYFVQ